MNQHVHTTPVFSWPVREENLFDFEQLDDVMQGEPEELVQLLDAFFSDTRAEVAEFAQMLEAGDQETVTRRLHTLKGIAASFGLVKLAEACLIAEQSVKNRKTAEVLERRFCQIITVLDKTEESLRRIRPQYLPTKS